MRKNVWIANDNGYVTFRNAKAYFETSIEKYRGKTTLWIDRYGYYEDADLNHLKALYIEVEKIVENGGIKQVRLRAVDDTEVKFWINLGFRTELRVTNAEGNESTILLKSLSKPFAATIFEKLQNTAGVRWRDFLSLFEGQRLARKNSG